MKIKPIGERVVLRQVKGEERTKSGIYLPKSEDKKEGIIIEVGTFKDGNPLPLSKGDKVLYGGYSSEEFETEGECYFTDHPIESDGFTIKYDEKRNL